MVSKHSRLEKECQKDEGYSDMLSMNKVFQRMRESQEKKGNKIRPRPQWRRMLAGTSGGSSDLPQETKRPTLTTKDNPDDVVYDALGYNVDSKVPSPNPKSLRDACNRQHHAASYS